MAKDYLSIEEACEALGVSEDDIRAMVADGRLHEVRDAGKVYIRGDEVAAMSAKEGSSVVDLSVTDEAGMTDEAADQPESFSSALSSLADSSSGLSFLDESPGDDEVEGEESAEVVQISPVPEDAPGEDIIPELSVEDIPEDLPAAPAEDGPIEEEAAPVELSSEIDLFPVGDDDSSDGDELSVEPAAAPVIAEDVPDLGLSGSSLLGLEDSAVAEAVPAEEPPAPAKKGISVFDDDEIEIDADPMGETQISDTVEELEGIGSGSGLLDLTRESDDTSLGAELLDVISPTGEGAEAVEDDDEPEIIEADEDETITDSADDFAVVEETEDDEEAVEAAAPAVKAAPRVAATGAMAGAVPMNICALLGIICLALVGLCTAASIQGAWPAFLNTISKGIPLLAVFGGLIVVSIVLGVIGILAGRK